MIVREEFAADKNLNWALQLDEKVKEYLPTRHFSQKEMFISIAAVILGFVTVSFLTFLGWIIKGILRLLHRGESAN